MPADQNRRAGVFSGVVADTNPGNAPAYRLTRCRSSATVLLPGVCAETGRCQLPTNTANKPGDACWQARSFNRRLNFVRTKINQLHRLDGPTFEVLSRWAEEGSPLADVSGWQNLPDAEKTRIQAELRRIKEMLNRCSVTLARLSGKLLTQPPATAGRPSSIQVGDIVVELGVAPDHLSYILGKPLAGLPPVPEDAFERSPEEAMRQCAHWLLEANSGAIKANLNYAADRLAHLLRPLVAEVDKKCRLALVVIEGEDSESLRVVRSVLRRYFYTYDEYDMVIYLILFGSGVGEPATVDIFRISPEDATNLIDERMEGRQKGGRRKLAGTALFHFGAFLDRRWRFNDLMWGRLDGAERLITILLPGDQHAALREQLIDEAQGAILKEMLASEARAALVVMEFLSVTNVVHHRPLEQIQEWVKPFWRTTLSD